MVELQPDSYPVVQEFLQNFQFERPRPIWRVGRSGFKNEVESKYISSETLAEQLPLERVEKLLEALFEGWTKPTPDARGVRDHYLRSFAILLCIGAGRYIDYFTDQYNLQDRYLPHDSKPSHFPTSSNRDLFAAFRAAQPPFCPYRLEFNIGYTLGEHDILPINSQERVDEGGSAIIWKVVVDGEYDSLVQREDNTANASLDRNHTYIVKTYRAAEAQKYYEIERDAFKMLRWHGRPPADVIEYYGSFVRGSTFNIILEYADLGTLDKYLENHLPPQTPAERILFWRHFTRVLCGLAHIHGQSEDHENLQMFRGWHQDIDPSNILVVSRGGTSDYNCAFKIADLGLSHFKKYTSSPGNNIDEDTFGTSAYGSPETQRGWHLQSCKLKVKQGVDIWSLGCVLSEVATWINHDWARVEEYRRRRRNNMQENTGSPTAGDCFHSGFDLLSSVKQTHEQLVENCRRNDDITPLIVSEMIQKMLHIRSDRPEAMHLFHKSNEIINKAERLLRSREEEPTASTMVAARTNNLSRKPTPHAPNPPSHHPVRQKIKSRQPPEMSVADGQELKISMSGSRRQFPEQHLLRSLNGRDHAFLIDTSESMMPYRPKVRNVFDLLAYMLLESDPDGLDIYYTNDREKLKGKTHRSILKAFDKHPFKGTPDMRERFADILARYQEKLGKKNGFMTRIIHKDTPSKGPRRLNLYVLTDAVWQPKTDLTIAIETLVSHLLKHGLTNKQIGIQFIRFGNDAEGIERLNRLDADMKLRLDVVDHTPADGNVWKMLHGAINDWFDDDDTEGKEQDIASEREHTNGRDGYGEVMNGAPSSSKWPHPLSVWNKATNPI